MGLHLEIEARYNLEIVKTAREREGRYDEATVHGREREIERARLSWNFKLIKEISSKEAGKSHESGEKMAKARRSSGIGTAHIFSEVVF